MSLHGVLTWLLDGRAEIDVAAEHGKRLMACSAPVPPKEHLKFEDLPSWLRQHVSDLQNIDFSDSFVADKPGVLEPIQFQRHFTRMLGALQV